MLFTKVFTTLALAATALAAPAPAADASTNESTLEVRAQALIDLWSGRNFLDNKFTGSGDVGQCVDLPSRFVNLARSGKAKPGFRCTIWFKTKCAGEDSFSFNANPGNAAFPDWADRKAKSWKCVKA